jgi:hypothetical protein
MTDEELNAIEARANAASPGPWRRARNVELVEAPDAECVSIAGSNNCDHIQGSVDMDFIAHAREDVPALVAEVRRLREALIQTHNHVENARYSVRADDMSTALDDTYKALAAIEATLSPKAQP